MPGSRVWDWPVRAFHWVLVALLGGAWATAEGPASWMVWHQRIGYTLIFLLAFRVLWGLWGSAHARFADFVHGPRAVGAYALALLRRRPAHFAGHTPLGGWMVLALLGLVAVQAGSGLFASDGIMTDGPLHDRVSRATGKLLTRIHHINFNVLLAAAGLHVAAVLAYLVVLRDNLITPMVTGRKPMTDPAGGDARAPWWRVALAAGGAAVVTWYLVT